MTIVRIVYMLCMIIEVYNIILHNIIFDKCQRWNQARKALKQYNCVYTNCQALKSIQFVQLCDDYYFNKWFQAHQRSYDYLFTDIDGLPEPLELEKSIALAFPKSTKMVAFIANFIEVVYGISIGALAILTPLPQSIIVVSWVFVLVFVHAWNERTGTMYFRWFPTVDALLRIGIFHYILSFCTQFS